MVVQVEPRRAAPGLVPIAEPIVEAQQSSRATTPASSRGDLFLVVYLVAMLTTLGPARSALGVYPAEALRYQ